MPIPGLQLKESVKKAGMDVRRWITQALAVEMQNATATLDTLGQLLNKLSKTIIQTINCISGHLSHRNENIFL